jgi:hypothetical protein
MLTGITSWVYPTEIFHLASRAKGVALATVAFSLAGGIVNEVTPYLITAVGFWIFIIFGLVNFGMLVPIFLFYIGKILPLSVSTFVSHYSRSDNSSKIETANRHLEDLDLLFAGESNLAWRAVKEFDLAKQRTNDAQIEQIEDIADNKADLVE